MHFQYLHGYLTPVPIFDLRDSDGSRQPNLRSGLREFPSQRGGTDSSPLEIGKMKDLRDDIFRDAMNRSVTAVTNSDDEVFKSIPKNPIFRGISTDV